MSRRFLFIAALGCFAASIAPAQMAPPPVAWAQDAPFAGLPSAAPLPKEDWPVLLADRKALPSRLAVVLATAETPAFTRELVRVEWRPGDPIDLYVIRPHGIKNPPVVLYLYGYPSQATRFRQDGWCERATAGGFAAVGFISALTGDRYLSRPMKEWFVSELQESLGKSTHDVQRILDYLAGRADLDMGRVGMFGQGSGGTIAVLAAQADRRIRVLDLLNPWGDWPDWLKDSPLVPDGERARYLQPEFLARVVDMDPLKYLSGLRLKSLRVQQVMDDVVTAPSAKKAIAAAVPAVSLISYPNTSAQMKVWQTGGMWEWIKAQLNAPATIEGTTVAAIH